MIVIAGPRFLDFLVEGGRPSPPFTQRQRNDFALGLVHETVHLEKDNSANPANFEDRPAEELRAWRKVDLNVVRELRRLNQPMNPRLIEADDALRSCTDEECEDIVSNGKNEIKACPQCFVDGAKTSWTCRIVWWPYRIAVRDSPLASVTHAPIWH